MLWWDGEFVAVGVNVFVDECGELFGVCVCVCV